MQKCRKYKRAFHVVVRGNYVHDLFNKCLNLSIRIDAFQRGTLIEQHVIFRTYCGAHQWWVCCFSH